jgi:predicted nucleic acid-binding Zn ribbon protein
MPLYEYKCPECEVVAELPFSMDYQPPYLVCENHDEDVQMPRAYGTINTGQMPTRAGSKMHRRG